MMMSETTFVRTARHTAAAAVVVTALWILPAAAAWAGPVTILEQHRSISASVSGPELAQDQRDVDAGGAYNDSVSVTTSGDGYANRAWADIESSFTGSGLHFLAHHGYEIEDDRTSPPGQEDELVATDAVSGVGMDVTFRLDEPMRYTFAAEARELKQDTLIGFNNDHPLWFVGPNGGHVEDGTGVLPAGQYQLTWAGGSNAMTGWPELRTSLWEYDLSLTLAPLDGGDGNGPNPIPLPAAVWSALAALGLAGVHRLRKARPV